MALIEGNAEVEFLASGAKPVPASGPRIPRREVEVTLPPEYPGFTFRLWVNFPARLADDLNQRGEGDAEEKQARMSAALSKVVLSHNGWLDDEGNPIPQPSDPVFWEIIPTELAAVIIACINRQIVVLPNSLRPARAS